MDSIMIEKMTLEDLNSISDILENDFDNFWNYNIFKKELENKNSKYIIAKYEDEIVGFVGITIVLDTADITNIVVKKNFRGNGIANTLMKKIIELSKSCKCSKINLEVNANNDIAINLYKKFGFKRVGKRNGYYNGNDGLLFTKALNNS